MNKKPKVSIIIPVYNIEEYIGECLQSVICQTYEHIEIIVIDDGSTDGSGQICDEYGKEDSRIKVIHERNKGISEVRNVGLDMCTGEYIVFVDGDDWIDEELVEVCLERALTLQSDCVQFNYADVRGAKITPAKQATCFRNNFEIIQAKFSLQLTHMLPCAVYKTTVFKSLRFPPNILCEDLYILPELMLNIEKMDYVDKVLYYYRARESSVVNTLKKKTVQYDVDYALSRIKYLTLLDQHFGTKWFTTRGLSSIYSQLLVSYIRDVKHSCLTNESRAAIEKCLRCMRISDYTGYNEKQRKFGLFLYHISPMVLKQVVKLRVIS